MRVRLVLLAALLLLPARVQGQCYPGSLTSTGECRLDAPSWGGEFAAFSANALIGGLTAGVRQAVKGESFGDAFVRGALGGAVTYGGKRLAVERFTGAGVLGRQVAAVGNSVARNAGDGIGMIDQLRLPLGPLWFVVDTRRDAPRRVQPRIDVMTTAYTIYGIVEENLELDFGTSLETGTPVFRTNNRLIIDDDSIEIGGSALAGTLYLADIRVWSEELRRETLAHELTHVLQSDQIFTLISDPLEDWAVDMLLRDERGQRWLDINLSSQVFALFTLAFDDYLGRPWEVEARLRAQK